jgi:hypothetical protein
MQISSQESGPTGERVISGNARRLLRSVRSLPHRLSFPARESGHRSAQVTPHEPIAVHVINIDPPRNKDCRHEECVANRGNFPVKIHVARNRQRWQLEARAPQCDRFRNSRGQDGWRHEQPENKDIGREPGCVS